MASPDLKHVKEFAVLLANDLRTGLTVYFTDAGKWSVQASDAVIIRSDEDASEAMKLATIAEQENRIVGPYLTDATATGSPTHIRERLRVDGPSINYLQNQN